MTGENPGIAAADVLAPLDPRRDVIRHAVLATVLAAATFCVFTATKEVKPLYVHAPWENDPFDTVVSFAMFFVPLLTAACLVRVSLCRRSESLPLTRVNDVLRGCRVAVATMTITLLVCWFGVACGANRPWDSDSAGLVVLLAIATAAAMVALVALRQDPALEPPSCTTNVAQSDWLSDIIMVARRQARWLGPVQAPAQLGVAWIEQRGVSQVCRHPLLTAAAAAATFGVVVLGYQSLREGYLPSVALLAIGLAACGMFAFLVMAGSYLGIARSATPLLGVRRRAVDASVCACAAAVFAFALRDSLWGIVGSNQAQAGPSQLAVLVAGTAGAGFVVLFATESLLRSHAPTPHQRGLT